MSEVNKIYGWRDDISWDKIRINKNGHLLVETQGGESITNYNLETTQLSVLSNVNSIKNNTSDTAVNTLDIGMNTANIDANFTLTQQELQLL